MQCTVTDLTNPPRTKDPTKIPGKRQLCHSDQLWPTDTHNTSTSPKSQSLHVLAQLTTETFFTKTEISATINIKINPRKGQENRTAWALTMQADSIGYTVFFFIKKTLYPPGKINQRNIENRNNGPYWNQPDNYWENSATEQANSIQHAT